MRHGGFFFRLPLFFRELEHARRLKFVRAGGICPARHASVLLLPPARAFMPDATEMMQETSGAVSPLPTLSSCRLPTEKEGIYLAAGDV